MPYLLDLNADVGEERGDDEGLLRIVTTANVAAGGHAGGGVVLARTVLAALGRGVAVGAHPSYADPRSFGRGPRPERHSLADVVDHVTEQVLAVGAVVAVHGARLSHVKAHGTLYNDAVVDRVLADALVAAVERARRDLGYDRLPIMGLSGSCLADSALAASVPFVAEAFADRAYGPDGALVPRSQAGSMIHDVDEICARVVGMAADGRVRAIDGSHVAITASTVCVHGDSPGAVEIARAVRAALESNGVTVASLPVPGSP